MRILAVIFNIVLLGFTCLVTLTEGAPKEAAYIVLTMMLVLIPLLNALVISRSGPHAGWLGFPSRGKTSEEPRKTHKISSASSVMRIVTIACNIVLLAFACWAIIDQYPHPREAGVFEFELLAILTPILSAVVLLRRGGSRGLQGLSTKGKAY